MKQIVSIVSIVLLLFSADKSIASGYKGSGESKQSSASFKYGGVSLGDSFVRENDVARTCEKMAKLELVVPKVQQDLFGKTYSVGGNQISIPVRIVSSFENKKTGAQWNSSERVITISQETYDISQRMGALKLWNHLTELDEEVADTLRHEAIHALVDMKYRKSFEDENGEITGEANDFYHFMSEMLAYVGGDGYREWFAARKISSNPDLYKGASVIADKFRKGEPYTPPAIGPSNKDQGNRRDSISMDDLKKMNLDDANGDWCQCANPGCVNTFKVVNGKHEGYLTFVCSHCKKVNVGFAREALKYEGIIKGEGGTPQWFGPNAEANAKAAGNAK